MKHLEIEYKTLLTEKEYTQLLPQFAHIAPILQTNYYIDTPDFAIKKARMSLRIRTFSHTAELTLKIPQKIGNLEYNQVIDFTECQDLLNHFLLPQGQIYTLVKEASIPIHELQILGHLTTLRYEKESEIGLMALDKNTYADKIDYELEVEVSHPESGKISFDHYLMENEINFQYASSKVARFSSTLLPDQK